MSESSLTGRAPPVDVKATPAARAIGWWLIATAMMVFAMAVIGAITRLTESGLSIMEWAPFSGTLPPLSQAEWQRLFDLYRTIPQYELMNRGMTLDEFRTIFWWEWIHRVWGRLIGLVFAIPLAWFWIRGAIPDWLRPHLLALLALGGLQGFMGWFMVASGFVDDRTAVSQYRLALHLGLALLIYAYLLWLSFHLLLPKRQVAQAVPLRHGLLALLALIALTLLSGAFVAGLRAGFTYNSFPLMDGRLVPAGYSQLEPWLINHFENIAAVQFNHRLLASLTLLGAGALWVWSRRFALAPAAARAFDLLAATALLQFILGVATLLFVVPVWLGALHQAGAILLLSLAFLALYRLLPAETVIQQKL